MEAFTPILITAGRFILASALLMFLYWMVWRKQATYQSKRLYLLILPLIALTISLIQVEVYRPQPTIKWIQMEETNIPEQPLSVLPFSDFSTKIEAIEENMLQPTISTGNWSEKEIIIIAYLLIVCLLCIPFVINLFQLKHIKKASISEIDKERNIRILSGEIVKAPFSFHRTIFLPKFLTSQQRRMILRHEQAHIAHRHYLDVWIAESLTRLFWFNPILWWSLSELRNVHEFEADNDVLASGEDVYSYQAILLEEVMHGDIMIANGFNHSFIRRRFIEMIQTTSHPMSRLAKTGSAAWLLCCCALLCCTIGEAETLYKLSDTSSVEFTNPEEPQAEDIIDDSTNAQTDDDNNLYKDVLSLQSGIKIPKDYILMSDYKKLAETSQSAQEGYKLLSDCIKKAQNYRQNLIIKAYQGELKHTLIEQMTTSYSQELFTQAGITLLKNGGYLLPDKTKVIENGEYPPMTSPINLPIAFSNKRLKYSAPVMERDKSPNYAVQNDHTWPVYTQVNVISEDELFLYATQTSNDGRLQRHQVYRSETCTYVTEVCRIIWDWQWFSFPSTTRLIDPQTGDQYMLRYVEYFPLDTKLWIHGQKDEYICFVYVFPPLGEEVNEVDFVDGFVPKADRLSNSGPRLRYHNIKVQDSIQNGKIIY